MYVCQVANSSAPRRVEEGAQCFSRAGQEEYDQEHRAERYQGRRGGSLPAQVQRLLHRHRGDEGAVGDGEEGTVGDPEHESYTAGVA